VSDSQTKAAQLFREAAEAGDPEGQFQYALCLRDGRGVSRDLAEAHKWLEKAVNAGHVDAPQILSQLQRPPEASPSLSPDTSKPANQSPDKENTGCGCAVIAGIVGLLFFAHSCKDVVSGGFFSADSEETNWPVALFATAIVATIAFFIGKKSK
jgi:TPR repeat protein